jgi:hypothetical protein
VSAVCICYRSVRKSIRSCAFIYTWNNESDNKACLTFKIQIGVVSTKKQCILLHCKHVFVTECISGRVIPIRIYSPRCYVMGVSALLPKMINSN